MVPVNVPIVPFAWRVMARSTDVRHAALVFSVSAAIGGENRLIKSDRLVFVVNDRQGAIVLRILMVTRQVKSMVVQWIHLHLIRSKVSSLTIQFPVNDGDVTNDPIRFISVLLWHVHTTGLP